MMKVGLKSNINGLGSYFLICPKCKAPREFRLFYTNVSVRVVNISVFPFHKRIAAICPTCKKLYYVKDDVAKSYVINRDTVITYHDLEEKK